jgi:3-phenylpropionate/trans-cinnamate dioxygenase ferredoxin reductase subunit
MLSRVPLAASSNVVVIGGGQAAAQFVGALRLAGHAGPVTLICEEPYAPYQRPPLSKEFLAGRCTVEWLSYRPEELYRQQGIALELGKTVAEIDRVAQRVRLTSGESRAYDCLAIATGARARRLAVAGADLPEIYYLRTIDDALAIQQRLVSAGRVLIIGGGFIGLETAAVLVRSGRQVTVLESGSRVLRRGGSANLAAYLTEIHTRAGVSLVTEAQVEEIRKLPRGVMVRCADGSSWEADLIIAGVGVLPNMELARDAGVACEDGVLVDEQAVTQDPRIVAFGDCARAPNAFLGTSVRFETVHNAVEQPKVCAQALLGGDARYSQVPWVWSDQYDLRIQIVGDCSSPDVIVRGDPAAGRFSAFHYCGDALRGACSINRPADFGAARRILQAGATLDRARAADSSYCLDTVVPPRARAGFERPWPRELQRVAGRISLSK